MKILVCGGSGFLGRHFMLSLQKKQHEIYCLDRYHAPFLEENKIPFIPGDFGERNLLKEVLSGMDAVIHLACTTIPAESNSDPVFDAASNIVGSIQLIEEAARQGVGRVLFLSSGGTVYGKPRYTPIDEGHPTDPECSYGIGKLTVEKYLKLLSRLYGFSGCAIRLANPYGEFQRTNAQQGVIPVFARKILHEEDISIWGDGSVKRDFVYVGDVAEAITALVENFEITGEINIGSGKATSILEIVEKLEKITGKQARCHYEKARKCDVPVNCLSIERARRLLQWEPKTDLDEGLSKIVSHLTRSTQQA